METIGECKYGSLRVMFDVIDNLQRYKEYV